MRLTMIDRIVALTPGERISAVKSLSLTERYLEDHFPKFPVMPGVLMLESMYQTAAWLLRVTDRFQHSLVTISEAKNIKYSDFVQPGQTLKMTVELQKNMGNEYQLKGQGDVDERVAVKGRLVLQLGNLATDNPDDAILDNHMIQGFRHQFRLLYPAGLSEIKS